MSYNKESGEITFDQSKISEDEEGTYKLKVTITDNTGLRNIYYVDVDVKGYDPQSGNSTQVGEDGEDEDPDSENYANQWNQTGTQGNDTEETALGGKCQAEIVSIDQFGRMKIEFKIDPSNPEDDKRRNLQSNKFS